MIIQLHLVGARASLVLAANFAAAQAHAADIGGPKPGDAASPPVPKEIPWDGFSGRGVRLRTLDSDEKEAVTEEAARVAGERATIGQYNRRRSREGVLRCLVEVTRQGQIADLATATWSKVTQIELESARGPLSISKLFTPKDLDYLANWWRNAHDASEADFEAISGGAKEIADNDG